MKITVSVEKAEKMCKKMIEWTDENLREKRNITVEQIMKERKYIFGQYKTREEAEEEVINLSGHRLITSPHFGALALRRRVEQKVREIRSLASFSEDGKIIIEGKDIFGKMEE